MLEEPIKKQREDEYWFKKKIKKIIKKYTY